jgi:hypothetical protein
MAKEEKWYKYFFNAIEYPMCKEGQDFTCPSLFIFINYFHISEQKLQEKLIYLSLLNQFKGGQLKLD